MGFFKAYDMRGTFGIDFTLDTVYRVGLVLPQIVGGRRWLVGRDCRESGGAMKDALIRGLIESGAEVTDLGFTTTPMTYFFTCEDDFDGGVMITASHNPPQDNGMKVTRRGGLPVGYNSGLAEIEAAVARMTDAYTGPVGDVVTSVINGNDNQRLARYCDWLLNNAGTGFENLRFAVDCSDGMAALLARHLFPQAMIFNDVPNGAFPHHAPNPLLAEARVQLASVVREHGLDCGVIFDGDADRCMFVDETGAFIQPDYLIPVLAETYSERGAVVIHDVRTSRGAIESLIELGFEPKMVPVGHAFAKVKLREYGALCGGELAGHYYFRDFHGCDSGALAALRILSAFAAAKRKGLTVSSRMRPIVSRYANSGEVNFQVADKDAAMERVRALAKTLGKVTGEETMDGYRIELEDGWVSVRKSNTEAYLRLLVEFRDAERMQAALAKLSPQA